LAHESNRNDATRTTNRYLKRIKYGNRTPNRAATTWQASDPTLLPENDWMFEVVFDYDDGHYQPVSPPNADPMRVSASVSGRQYMAVRQDPFSSYRPGFEVRTYRLCRRVLMSIIFPQS